MCRLPDGRIGHASTGEDTGAFAPILCFESAAARVDVTLFAAARDQPIELLPNAWQAVFYPMRRLVQADGQRFAFAHPYSASLVIALPTEGGSTGLCALSGLREAGDWECFRLVEITTASPELLAIMEQAAKLHGMSGPGGLRASLERADAPGEREAIARLVPERDYEQLAAAFLADAALRERVLLAAGPDPYATGLRNLVATAPGMPAARRGWLRRQAPPAQVDLSNDARFSEFSANTQDGTYRSFVHKLNAVLRRRRAPSKRLCVLTTMRDEGPYILEWLAHHRRLGVDHFFIYSNDNKDGSDDLLGALSRSGVITWIENKDATSNIQIKAYAHCLSIVPGILDYEWCALLDADEFIVVQDGVFDGIGEYLTWQEARPVDVVSLPWAIFWSSGQARWTDELSLKRFDRQNHGSGLGKSVFRPRKFTFSYPHHPASADHTAAVIVRDNTGDAITYRRGQMTGHEIPEARYRAAWINHYFSRSAEELLWKWSRGRGDSQLIAPFADMPDDFVNGFMQHFDRAEMNVPDAVSSRLPGVRAEIAALLGLPGVRDAYDHIIRERQKWSARTSDLVGQLQKQTLSDVKKSFLALLTA